jgi:uncharacterized protein
VTFHLQQIHPRFDNVDAFAPSAQYRLLPMRFTIIDERLTAVSNAAGEVIVVTCDTPQRIIQGKIEPGTIEYDELLAHHLIADNTSTACLDLLSLKIRSKYSQLAQFTALHVFVVTLRCDHTCRYCQVSRAAESENNFDMSITDADAAIGLMFTSPSPTLTVEFQGGEPLLNFELVQHIVLSVLERNKEEGRDIAFVIATTLTLLTDEHLEFCQTHGILISTSLDGPAALHNRNRPRPGKDSHQQAVMGIHRVRKTLGRDRISALLTTTKASLDQPEAIINEYVKHGFESIFLRWLSPYGFAVKAKNVIGYDTSSFLKFYARGLRHILDLNAAGIEFREEYTALILRRLLRVEPTGFVDLMSPTGGGIAAVLYNYDGSVHVSDESRMMAEQGDSSFCIGTVTDDHSTLFANPILHDLVLETMVEGIPECADCAFQLACGTDPLFHYTTQGDVIGHMPTSAFCNRNMFVFRHVLQLLNAGGPDHETLMNWAGC